MDNESNYLVKDGYFKGQIIGNSYFLDVPFDELEPELQNTIVEYGEKYNLNDLPLDIQKQCYEFSWDIEEIDQPVTFDSYSQLKK